MRLDDTNVVLQQAMEENVGFQQKISATQQATLIVDASGPLRQTADSSETITRH